MQTEMGNFIKIKIPLQL